MPTPSVGNSKCRGHGPCTPQEEAPTRDQLQQIRKLHLSNAQDSSWENQCLCGSSGHEQSQCCDVAPLAIHPRLGQRIC